MSTTKIVIIVLVLIALVFIIFVTKGALSEDQPKAGKRNDAVSFTKQNKAPGWTKTISSMFGSLRPKLVLSRKSFTSNASESVPPDEDHSMRTGTFLRRAGSVHIRYVDLTENAGEDLRVQEFDLPNPDNSDPNRGSIVVLKRGGQLQITCVSTPCRVDLE